jgi:SAM-dependent MidA family methyltransferase
MHDDATGRTRPADSAGSRPGGDPRRLESDAGLVDAIRDEILAHGPITFARFMERALYERDRGYYAGPAPRPGRDGDFLTAPEAHDLFGRTLARQVAECWHRLGGPAEFTVREYGAGNGLLAAAILAGLRDEEPGAYAATTYEPVELNPWRMTELRERLDREGTGDRLGPALDSAARSSPGSGTRPALGPHGTAATKRALGPHGTAATRRAAAARQGPHRTAPITGVVLANEFLDALPVHRVERRDGRLVEIGVGWRDGWFADEPMPALAQGIGAGPERGGLSLEEGQRTEVNPGIGDWTRTLARELARGWVIVVDYGLSAAGLRSPERTQGTLKGVAGHRIEPDPYARVGRQDLTAHVDLTALEREAVDAGLDVLGSTTQARFLVYLGMGPLLVAAQERARSVTQALETRSAARWLLDPRGTGGFAVVVLGRDVPREPPLAGLGGAEALGENPGARGHPGG